MKIKKDKGIFLYNEETVYLINGESMRIFATEIAIAIAIAIAGGGSLWLRAFSVYAGY